jgi:hypothetical protein
MIRRQHRVHAMNVHRTKRLLLSNKTRNMSSPCRQLTSSLASKQPVLEVHVTAHCQGITFSTTLLSTLKAQYKIGIIEGVVNTLGRTSRFTAIIHEHALHFLNNNQHHHRHLRTVPSVGAGDHVRIDFPQIRCYGNYIDGHDQRRNQLKLRTNIDLVKLTITADFLAQLVFVTRVIIHEIDEILAKVSGFDQARFSSTTDEQQSDRSISIDDHTSDNDEQTTRISYYIDVFIEGFKIIGQTPSTTVVKFENEDRNEPILIQLTNYDKTMSCVLHSKPIVDAQLNLKLTLGQFLSTGAFQHAAYFKTKVHLRNSFNVSMSNIDHRHYSHDSLMFLSVILVG